MANKNIVSLTAITVPLAGTEVIPIWDGTTTTKVTVANLTAGRAVSVGSLVSAGAVSGTSLAIDNPSNGIGTIVTGATGAAANQFQTFNHSPGGGAYSYTNFQIAGQDIFAAGLLLSPYAGNAVVNAPHSTGSILFKINGVQYFSLSPTGNITQTVAAKGINFTANTPAAGMTSQLLNWYEEGTWTITRGGFTEVLGGGSITNTGTYTRIGRLVKVTVTFVCAGGATLAAAGGATAYVNLPSTPANFESGTWANNTTYATSGEVIASVNGNMYVVTAWAAASASWTLQATYTV